MHHFLAKFSIVLNWIWSSFNFWVFFEFVFWESLEIKFFSGSGLGKLDQALLSSVKYSWTLSHWHLPISGLFLTDSADSLKRAWFYCRKCHANISSEKAVNKCGCKRTAVRMMDKDFRHATRLKKGKNNHPDKVISLTKSLLKLFSFLLSIVMNSNGSQYLTQMINYYLMGKF